VLTSLNIQGLAIIDSLVIEFGSGFNVITGETGAGKSILIKALGFLLGAKATAEHVRSGRETATVTGEFVVPRTHRAVAVLDRLGIPHESEGKSIHLIIRRQVSTKGRSQAWLNDVPVTLTAMKELSEALVDVFAQHEHQRILDPSEHLGFVDQFVGNKALFGSYRDAWSSVQSGLAELRDAVEAFRNGHRDLDYLQFRIRELDAFSPSTSDYASVVDRCTRAERLLKTSGTLARIQHLLSEGAGGESLAKAVHEMVRLLGQVAQSDAAFTALADDAAQVAARIDDLSFAFDSLSSGGGELDEQEIESAQERLAGYQGLFRKTTAGDVDGLLAEWEKMAAELGRIEGAASHATDLIAKISADVILLDKVSRKLSEARRKAADEVVRKIETELRELAMPGATLAVEFQPLSRSSADFGVDVFGAAQAEAWGSVSARLSGFSAEGSESAHFLLAANKGEPAMPLERIASGGEVSRIMLALKKALSAGADTCILVFDEIDTGISGRVADIVGRKLAELAHGFQVICISHLPQVAAYADSHFRVVKKSKGSRTESTIERLSARESTEEIARLLSGTEVTPSSIANAKQLVSRARSS